MECIAGVSAHLDTNSQAIVVLAKTSTSVLELQASVPMVCVKI